MLGERRVDPSTLQGVHKRRKDKEERLAAVLAGGFIEVACQCALRPGADSELCVAIHC